MGLDTDLKRGLRGLARTIEGLLASDEEGEEPSPEAQAAFQEQMQAMFESGSEILGGGYKDEAQPTGEDDSFFAGLDEEAGESAETAGRASEQVSDGTSALASLGTPDIEEEVPPEEPPMPPPRRRRRPQPRPTPQAAPPKEELPRVYASNEYLTGREGGAGSIVDEYPGEEEAPPRHIRIEEPFRVAPTEEFRMDQAVAQAEEYDRGSGSSLVDAYPGDEAMAEREAPRHIRIEEPFEVGPAESELQLAVGEPTFGETPGPEIAGLEVQLGGERERTPISPDMVDQITESLIQKGAVAEDGSLVPLSKAQMKAMNLTANERRVYTKMRIDEAAKARRRDPTRRQQRRRQETFQGLRGGIDEGMEGMY